MRSAAPVRPTSALRAVRGGVTLIEALIAIVIVAVILPLALSGVSHALQAADQTRKQDVARRLAETRLARVVADGSWQSSALSGTFDATQDGEDADAFAWQVSLTPWRDPAVQIIVMTVSWGSVEAGQAVTLTSLVTPPATTSATSAGAASPATPSAAPR